jgi:uncharacterized protein (TIGR03435 family)
MQMQELDDHALLSEYVAYDSEEAFAALVARHINKVYSVALRHTGNPAAAEEISQAVFVILARKSRRLGKNVNLSGWLYQTARLTTVTFVRGQIRRARREREAFMQTNLNQNESEVWKLIAPLLDEAMAALNQTDRNAVMLRFFDGKSMREVAAALGANENTARQRVGRAVEKMQNFFFKRGISSTTAIITAAISANSVQAAPVLLANTITAVAMTKGVAAGDSTLTLIKGALKFMAWTKVKTAIVGGVMLLCAAGTITVATTALVNRSRASSLEAVYEPIWAHPDMSSIPAFVKAPPALIIRPTRYPSRDNDEGIWTAGGSLSVNDKGLGVNESIPSLISLAYGSYPVRIVLPANIPDAKYDMVETLPFGQNAAALRAEIKKRFGLVAHTETRETDVLLLQVSRPAGLQAHVSTGGIPHSEMTGDGQVRVFNFANMKLSDIAKRLENWFGNPIVDQSGLSGQYSFQLRWSSQLTAKKDVVDVMRGQLDQLGLELMPGRGMVEMLVVEKAKD